MAAVRRCAEALGYAATTVVARRLDESHLTGEADDVLKDWETAPLLYSGCALHHAAKSLCPPSSGDWH